MENLEAFFNTLQTQIGILSLGFGGILSLIQCFFGYKLRKLWIVCAGFLIGFGVGAPVGALLLPTNEYTLLLTILIGLGSGILLALAAFKLYRAGMFLYSLYIVFIAVSGLFPDKFAWVGLIIGLAAGIAAGVLTLHFLRPFIICTTAVGGGISGTQQLLALFHVTSLPVVLGVGAAAALLGLIVQFRLNPPVAKNGG